MNNDLTIVAIARVHQNNSLFNNTQLTLHHTTASCINKNSRRNIHRAFFKSLLLLDAKRCSKCWTDRTWRNAYGDIKMSEIERKMREIE